ncbi:hypothetical protein J8G26_16760 [Acidovorax sp. JG5]|jgi:uncharacterized damage-inducible protein DinB|uniref:hypothetical protein n=1 Tax=Acidovorax sp. JG5 TaxID=2822718 RepID=UPI001B32E761|nr:hypothetical protein [Acidovorax sp. JG5]MBP3982360.1 hypothetical protein [Acidovorax sp. JG5]
MDAVAHFTQLARYNVWATARVLDAVRALPDHCGIDRAGPALSGAEPCLLLAKPV